MRRKKQLLSKRLEIFAAQAYLAVIMHEQGAKGGVKGILELMSDALESDKKLAQHLIPELNKFCKEHNIELHGSHAVESGKH